MSLVEIVILALAAFSGKGSNPMIPPLPTPGNPPGTPPNPGMPPAGPPPNPVNPPPAGLTYTVINFSGGPPAGGMGLALAAAQTLAQQQANLYNNAAYVYDSNGKLVNTFNPASSSLYFTRFLYSGVIQGQTVTNITAFLSSPGTVAQMTVVLQSQGVTVTSCVGVS